MLTKLTMDPQHLQPSDQGSITHPTRLLHQNSQLGVSPNNIHKSLLENTSRVTSAHSRTDRLVKSSESFQLACFIFGCLLHLGDNVLHKLRMLFRARSVPVLLLLLQPPPAMCPLNVKGQIALTKYQN